MRTARCNGSACALVIRIWSLKWCRTETMKRKGWGTLGYAIYFGEDNFRLSILTHILSCQPGSLPFQYLGIPLSGQRLLCSAWMRLIDRIQGRLVLWKSNLLSSGVCVTLVNSLFSSILTHLMSFYYLPEWRIKAHRPSSSFVLLAGFW